MNRGTILVTGGCGFIGSHIVDRLLRDGHAVVVIDDLSTGKLENLSKEATFYCGNIADRPFVEHIFAAHKIHAIIHEAARINTSIATEQPDVDTRISILGTINLLELAVAYKVAKFLYASSVAVYGRTQALPAYEEAAPTPIYSYGIAKACAEEYVRFYGLARGVAYHILRYGNVYGPRQPIYGEVGVIAIFTKRVLSGEPLTVYGDGMHQRDFIYVDDAVEATLRLLDIQGSDTFNVAGGQGITVNDVVAAFEAAADKKLIKIARPERLGEIGKFFSSSQKLQRRLGWQPAVSLADGIRATLAAGAAEGAQ